MVGEGLRNDIYSYVATSGIPAAPWHMSQLWIASYCYINASYNWQFSCSDSLKALESITTEERCLPYYCSAVWFLLLLNSFKQHLMMEKGDQLQLLMYIAYKSSAHYSAHYSLHMLFPCTDQYQVTASQHLKMTLMMEKGDHVAAFNVHCIIP